jgi:hypothetical protein
VLDYSDFHTADDTSEFVQKWRFALRKPLVLSVELREPKNPERINGLNKVEQVAQRRSAIIP